MFKKSVSCLLSALMLLTNTILLHAGESNIWAERKKPANFDSQFSLGRHPGMLLAGIQNVRERVYFHDPGLRLAGMTNLPLQHCAIRKISKPESPNPKSQTVILIQDIHRNKEAQRNIEKTIEALIGSKRVGLVALEGAFEEINARPFQRFPDQDSVTAVADYLLREDRISGPVHLAFTGGSKMPDFIGVDDKNLYDANVKAVQESAAVRAEALGALERRETALTAAKRAALNPALKSFDDIAGAFHRGKVGLKDFVSYLDEDTQFLTPAIESFISACRLESRIPFAQVETELREISRRGGSLSRYPALESYTEYVLLADGIDAEQLLSDVRELEVRRYNSLIRSEAERRLIEEGKWINLTRKLVNFELTAEEWEDYYTFQSRHPAKAGMTTALFEDFYRLAEARNEKMAENLLQAVTPAKAGVQVSNQFLKKVQRLDSGFRRNDVAVLVAGGFHSLGITKILKKSGAKVVTVVPKITRIESASGFEYLSHFTREKTPLDRIFEGEKLFLTQKVCAPPSVWVKLLKLRVAFNSAADRSRPIKSRFGNEQWAATFTAAGAFVAVAITLATVSTSQAVLIQSIRHLCQNLSDIFISLSMCAVVIIGWRFHGFINPILRRMGLVQMSFTPDGEIPIPLNGLGEEYLYRCTTVYDSWVDNVKRHGGCGVDSDKLIQSINQWWRSGPKTTFFDSLDHQAGFFWLVENIYSPGIDLKDEIRECISFEIRQYFESLIHRLGPGFFGYTIIRLVVLEYDLKELPLSNRLAYPHKRLVKTLQELILRNHPTTSESTLRLFGSQQQLYKDEIEELLDPQKKWASYLRGQNYRPFLGDVGNPKGRLVNEHYSPNHRIVEQENLYREFVKKLIPNDEKRKAWDEPISVFVKKLQAQPEVKHIHIEHTGAVWRNAKEANLGNYLKFQLRLIEELIQMGRFRQVVFTNEMKSPYHGSKDSPVSQTFESFWSELRKLCNTHHIEITVTQQSLSEYLKQPGQESFISLGPDIPCSNTDSMFVYHEIMEEWTLPPQFTPKLALRTVVSQLFDRFPTYDVNRTVGVEIDGNKGKVSVWHNPYLHENRLPGNLDAYQFAFVTSNEDDNSDSSNSKFVSPSDKLPTPESPPNTSPNMDGITARVAAWKNISIQTENIGLMVFGTIGVLVLGLVWGLCVVVGGFALLHAKQFWRRYKAWRLENESGWAAFWWAKNLAVFLAAATLLTTALNTPTLFVNFYRTSTFLSHPFGVPVFLLAFSIVATAWWYHEFINPVLMRLGLTPMSMRTNEGDWPFKEIFIQGPNSKFEFSYRFPRYPIEHDVIVHHSYSPRNKEELAKGIEFSQRTGLRTWFQDGEYDQHFFWLVENVYSPDFHLDFQVRQLLSSSLFSYFRDIHNQNEDFLRYALIRLVIVLHSINERDVEYAPEMVGRHHYLVMNLLNHVLTFRSKTQPNWNRMFVERELNDLAKIQPALIPEINSIRDPRKLWKMNETSGINKEAELKESEQSGGKWVYHRFAPELKNPQEREGYEHFVQSLTPDTDEKRENWEYPIDGFVARLHSEKYEKKKINHVHIQTDRDTENVFSGEALNNYLKFQLELIESLISEGKFKRVIFNGARYSVPAQATYDQVNELIRWVNDELDIDRLSDPRYEEAVLGKISHVFGKSADEEKNSYPKYWLKLREIRQRYDVRITITSEALTQCVNNIPDKFISVGFDYIQERKKGSVQVLHLMAATEYFRERFYPKDALASAVNVHWLANRTVGVAIHGNDDLERFLNSGDVNDSGAKGNQLKNFDFSFVTNKTPGPGGDFFEDPVGDPSDNVSPRDPNFDTPVPSDSPVGVACSAVWNWLERLLRPRPAGSAALWGLGTLNHRLVSVVGGPMPQDGVNIFEIRRVLFPQETPGVTRRIGDLLNRNSTARRATRRQA